ncbi:hypothetical protein THZG08_180024 [Vibrio owensii]|nr:hypothetical protein THZG08_180024 [Vibrio owensii]CAH1541620.1 hypothetical protein THF5H11_30562 [Vibrio jasicida]
MLFLCTQYTLLKILIKRFTKNSVIELDIFFHKLCRAFKINLIGLQFDDKTFF